MEEGRREGARERLREKEERFFVISSCRGVFMAIIFLSTNIRLNPGVPLRNSGGFVNNLKGKVYISDFPIVFYS